MAEVADSTVAMRDFPGLILDQDPLDLAGGAAREQTNLISFMGELNVRKGFRPLSFDSIVDAT